MPENREPSSADELQFRKAEPIAEPNNTLRCVSCSEAITTTYFHAQGQVVCPECAGKIELGQQAPPPFSMATAVFYGSLAALAGLILYAGVAIATGLEVGLISILIGFMVGKAVRIGSKGLGGRPQQILAVALTYSAISVSSIPVYLWQIAKNPPKAGVSQEQTTHESSQQPPPQNAQPVSFAQALLMLVGLGLASPFLQLFNNVGSGLLSLAILFFGLSRAWVMTGRTDILVVGPYKLESA